MLTKAAYNRSVEETLCAQLDAISLRVGLHLTTIPQMSPYPDKLSRPWEAEESPYEDDDEE